MARKNSEIKPYRPLDETFVKNTPTVFRGGRSNQPENGATEVVEKKKPGKLTKYARYLTTEEEFRDLQRFTDRFSEAAGTTVEIGKLLRACNAVMLHAEEDLIERAKAAGPLKRPRNDDLVGLSDFEQRLAEILSAAFKKAEPLR